MLFVSCLISQQHTSVFSGFICSNNCMCCHTEIDATMHLTVIRFLEFLFKHNNVLETESDVQHLMAVMSLILHHAKRDDWIEKQKMLAEVCVMLARSGAGIMESDDRQVTTALTVQPSFHHQHLTNQVS